MKWFEKVNLEGGRQVSLVAANCHVQGELVFGDEMIVNGRVAGVINAETQGAELTIGAKGEVIGNIFAPKIVISGEVRGDIYAFDAIELTESARISGNLYYHRLKMAPGCRYTGSMRQMQGSDIRAMVLSEEAANRRTAMGRLQAVQDSGPSTTEAIVDLGGNADVK
ncbi:MAG: polymer-forming cytoskeletal protein [Proteobacteria bacterium]|jgi:cytoskeletal protein CcmA (bactofilin family)|nr:polymer-forming cytoskeletal protein [Pseudomonadota bacterium]MDA0958494.1 polymer-forming cytoskeletal protein [Pseudomonadota bacterium]